MTGGLPAPGYDAAHFEKLIEIEDRHFWFTTRNVMLAGILARIPLADGACALEIGAGTGNTLRVLERAYPRAALVGMDLYGEGFAAARRRTRAHLVRAAIERLPFRRPFDLVAAFDVLEHVADDRAALASILRLLAPGGHLVLTVPAFARLWSRFDEDSHHVRRYELNELGECLAGAGYAVERLTFFMGALYPMLRAARWLSDRMPDRPGASPVARELRIVPVVNPAMTWLLGAEARLVAAGTRLPFGTSLLAVARRRT